MTTTQTVHAFELAGLGKAPFRFLGLSREVYQAIPGDPECPIQPGASCDFCGQAIYNVCRILSADGRTFKVGCDCVAKTGDKGLRKVVDAATRKVAADKRAAKAAVVAEALEAALADDAVRAQLATAPHPRGFEGKTLLDWADWMMAHAGARGRLEVAKAIAKAA